MRGNRSGVGSIHDAHSSLSELAQSLDGRASSGGSAAPPMKSHLVAGKRSRKGAAIAAARKTAALAGGPGFLVKEARGAGRYSLDASKTRRAAGRSGPAALPVMPCRFRTGVP